MCVWLFLSSLLLTHLRTIQDKNILINIRFVHQRFVSTVSAQICAYALSMNKAQCAAE